MSICTDCILSRLTVINVEQADIGYYYINATSSGFPSAFGRIDLYGKNKFLSNLKYLVYFFILATADCQQFITFRNNKGCKRIYTKISSSNTIFSPFYTFQILTFVLFIHLF